MNPPNLRLWLSELLHERRKELGFTRKEFAQALDIGLSALGRYERAETAPDMYVGYSILKRLGVSLEDAPGMKAIRPIKPPSHDKGLPRGS